MGSSISFGVSTPGAAQPTRGVLLVHSCSRAVCAHVEWALSHICGSAVRLAWTPQHLDPGSVRAEIAWRGAVGSAAAIASALRSFPVRFEVTEDPAAGGEGERYAGTPGLGLHRSVTGPAGEVLVSEYRIRAAIDRALTDRTASIGDLAIELETLLGDPWDDELEPYRRGGEAVARRAVAGA